MAPIEQLEAHIRQTPGRHTYRLIYNGSYFLIIYSLKASRLKPNYMNLLGHGAIVKRFFPRAVSFRRSHLFSNRSADMWWKEQKLKLQQAVGEIDNQTSIWLLYEKAPSKL